MYICLVVLKTSMISSLSTKLISRFFPPPQTAELQSHYRSGTVGFQKRSDRHDVSCSKFKNKSRQ